MPSPADEALRTLSLFELDSPPEEQLDWPDILCAVMEGREREWVCGATLSRVNGVTHIHWHPTPRGKRAIAAYRRREAHR